MGHPIHPSTNSFYDRSGSGSGRVTSFDSWPISDTECRVGTPAMSEEDFNQLIIQIADIRQRITDLQELEKRHQAKALDHLSSIGKDTAAVVDTASNRVITLSRHVKLIPSYGIHGSNTEDFLLDPEFPIRQEHLFSRTLEVEVYPVTGQDSE